MNSAELQHLQSMLGDHTTLLAVSKTVAHTRVREAYGHGVFNFGENKFQELKQKQDAALTNKGGGKAGLADRKGGAAGHAKFKCPICGMAAPSIKSGELHWDSKHPKMPFKPEEWSDLHAIHGGTTKGVAVKGAEKEKTVHELKKTEAGRKRLAEIEKEKLEKQFQDVKLNK